MWNEPRRPLHFFYFKIIARFVRFIIGTFRRQSNFFKSVQFQGFSEVMVFLLIASTLATHVLPPVPGVGCDKLPPTFLVKELLISRLSGSGNKATNSVKQMKLCTQADSHYRLCTRTYQDHMILSVTGVPISLICPLGTRIAEAEW